jgi:hypothetical protein
MTARLTGPQLRALRFYAGTRAERTAPGFPLGGAPRWDVVRKLRAAGLIENAHDPSVSFDMVATEAGRALLAQLDGGAR